MSHLVELDDAANVLQGRLQMANTAAAEAMRSQATPPVGRRANSSTANDGPR